MREIEFNDLPEAIRVISKHLKEDLDYRRTWEAAMCMSIYDQLKGVYHPDLETKLSKGVKNFIDQLCAEGGGL